MIRLGVIGCGGRISGFIRGELQALAPEARVVGVVDPDEAGARARLPEPDRAEAAFYPGVDALVRGARPDALLIGTRCNLHAPFAIEASRHGLPLFLEKPVATGMEQALALEAAFEKARGPVVVSFPLRVSALCDLAGRLLAEGAVGRPEHALAVNYVPYGTCYFDGHYRDYAVTQGLFLQKATHDFDYLMHLMDAPIVRVAATAQWGRVFGGGRKPAGQVCSRCDEAETCLESPANRVRNRSGGSGWGQDHPCVFGEDLGRPETGMNEDASNALVEFKGGARGVYTQVFYTRRDAGSRGATISGYLGTVSFDWYRNELRRVRHHAPFSDVSRVDTGLGHFGGDRALADNFLGVLRGTAASRAPIEAGLQSVYACLAAKESAETGRFVEVRQVGAAGG